MSVRHGKRWILASAIAAVLVLGGWILFEGPLLPEEIIVAVQKGANTRDTLYNSLLWETKCRSRLYDDIYGNCVDGEAGVAEWVEDEESLLRNVGITWIDGERNLSTVQCIVAIQCEDFDDFYSDVPQKTVFILLDGNGSFVGYTSWAMFQEP